MRWGRYVTVAQRRTQAARQLKKLGGGDPVVVEGRKIARTFWGEAWCSHLERYCDYSNRLPRGRTYLRNGSVVDLRIEAGAVHARVSGSSLYTVTVGLKPLAAQGWEDLKRRCAGQIGSLVELLQGSLSKGVMEVVTTPSGGLFPTREELSLSCSCPDWAVMCKHVAAVLYGVGARLDERPELLFTLRGVDPAELTDAAVTASTAPRSRTGRKLESDDLAALFGIDLVEDDAPGEGSAPPAPAPAPQQPPARAPQKAAAAPQQPPAPRRKAVPAPAPPAPGSLRDRVLQIVRDEGRISTGEAVERLRLYRPDARALLTGMAEQGFLRQVGERGRGVHFVAPPRRR